MTLSTAQSFSDGSGQIYCTFSVTDAALGNPTFHLAGQTFYSTNVHGGPKVSPVVLSWGGLTLDIGGSADSIEMVLAANADCIPSNGTAKKTVMEWLNLLQLADVAISIYQWNQFESTQEVIWQGYIASVGDLVFSEGNAVVSLILTATDRALSETEISTPITKADFAQAPIQSLGRMPPIVFGNADNVIGNPGTAASLANFGFPMPGARGIIVDENEATAKVTVRFANNDGAVAAHTFAAPTSDDPSTNGDLWIYDPAMSAYGLVDAASYSITNDTSKLEVVVDAAPKVFFFVRPSALGDVTAAGLTDAYKIIDSDPSNYSESLTTDYSWAFFLPSVFLSARVKSVGCIVDWENGHASKNRQIQYGIHDDYFGTAPGPWLRNKSKTQLLSTGLTAITYQATAAERYIALDFTDHTGSSTNDAFGSGAFITNNTGDALQKALQLRVFVNDLGGAHSGRDGVRIYNVGFLIEVDYPVVPRGLATAWLGSKFWDENPAHDWIEFRVMQSYYESTFGPTGKTALQARKDALSRLRGTDFFARGRFRKDTAGGTYTGTGSDVITKPCDIAYYILHKLAGKTVNTTAGTLGNFVDPRSTGICANANLLLQFGPDIVFKEEALQTVEARFGVEVFEDSGTYQIIPQDLNPHSSRVYRSTSNPVSIGKDDIDVGSFSVDSMNPAEIENSVQFNYSHGYPDREPGAQFAYDNHLSQKWWGKKKTLIIDEPSCIQQNLRGGTHQYAKDLAWWHGWKKGRPRLRVSCRLHQGFYDLRRGNTFSFKGLEDIGIPLPAYRSGLIDYYFTSTSGGTDYGDSAAPVFIAAAGNSSIVIGLSQQVAGLIFSVATAAAYTTVGSAWKYSSAAGGDGTVAFSAFSGVTNADALKSTGVQAVGWTRPNFWLWKKGNYTLGGTTYGPCYWIAMDYQTPTIQGLGDARVSYTPGWEGRIFSVLRAVRTPGNSPSDYPGMDVRAIEVM